MTEELHLLEISKWQRAVDAAEEKINLATLDCNSKAEFRKKHQEGSGLGKPVAVKKSLNLLSSRQNF